jgi:aspartate aminotransferase
MAVLDPGDECHHPGALLGLLSGHGAARRRRAGQPYAGPEQGYKITPAQLAAAITPRTRLLLLNSPSNPTGAAYTRAELRAFGEVLCEHPQVVIGTDDMYEKIYWAPEPFTSFTAGPELYDRTVTINGVSKAYAMTGWRIGYCGGPKEIVTAMGTDPGSVDLERLEHFPARSDGGTERRPGLRAEMNKAFKERHDFVVAGLNAIPGVSCLPGAGHLLRVRRRRGCDAGTWICR